MVVCMDQLVQAVQSITKRKIFCLIASKTRPILPACPYYLLTICTYNHKTLYSVTILRSSIKLHINCLDTLKTCLGGQVDENLKSGFNDSYIIKQFLNFQRIRDLHIYCKLNRSLRYGFDDKYCSILY